MMMKSQVFFDKEILIVDSNHTCLAAISLDSARSKNENSYLQKNVNTLRKMWLDILMII